MKVSVSSIMVRERVRHDVGDVAALMESMRQHGQLNPITITRDNELIAGHRRLLAARGLAWQHIEATVIDNDSEVEKLALELEENVHRKDFSPEELLAGYRRLEKLRRPGICRRVGGFFKGFFTRFFRRASRVRDARTVPETVGDARIASRPPALGARRSAASGQDDAAQYGI